VVRLAVKLAVYQGRSAFDMAQAREDVVRFRDNNGIIVELRAS